MDHSEAVRMQAATKYVLGELPQALRDEYEEHYFDCAECALDVRAAAVFSDNARNVLCQAEREADLKAVAPAGSRWLAWLRPVIAVPAFAVLLVVVAYQNVVTIPRAKQEAASQVLPMFSLIGANTRGPEGTVFHVRRGERFGVYVDVPVDSSYRVYVLQLQDPGGHSVILRSLTYEEAQKTQAVEVNPGGRPGAYELLVLGRATSDIDAAKGTLLANMKFDVEFVN